MGIAIFRSSINCSFFRVATELSAATLHERSIGLGQWTLKISLENLQGKGEKV